MLSIGSTSAKRRRGALIHSQHEQMASTSQNTSKWRVRPGRVRLFYGDTAWIWTRIFSAHPRTNLPDLKFGAQRPDRLEARTPPGSPVDNIRIVGRTNFVFVSASRRALRKLRCFAMANGNRSDFVTAAHSSLICVYRPRCSWNFVLPRPSDSPARDDLSSWQIAGGAIGT